MSGTALRYGRGEIELPPALAALPRLEAPGLAPAAEPEALWAGAAREAAARAAARLGATGRLALVVPDRTRPLPLPRLLPPLLAALRDHGVAPDRVSIVAASGIHAPMSRAELAGWIGADAASSGVALAPHDADAPAVLLGRTPSGLEVAAHPAVAGAAASVLLGRIVFHYLAGFGGGRKMLVPGVSARRTILAVHGRCLSPEAGRGRHPLAAKGVLEGNPVHAAACEAARVFPPAVALHVQVAARAEGDALAAVTVGDPFEDHARACASYAAAHRVALGSPLDAVVVTAGGHPTDRDLVQAHKALDAVAPVVRDGGVVVFVAACGDGIGNREVEDGLRHGGPARIEEALRREFRVGVHTALALRQKTARLRVLALTELPDEALALAGMERVRSLDEAAAAVAALPRAAVAPRGGSLLYQLG